MGDSVVGRGFGRRIWLVALLGCAGCSGPGDLDPSGVNPVSEAGTAIGSTSGDESADASTDTAESMSGTGTSTGDVEITVDCGDPNPAAVGATFEHRPFVDPPDYAWAWSVAGLPEGLAFNPVSGELSGTPEVAGTFEYEISVSSIAGDGAATCTLTVAEALTFDMDALGKPCFGPGDDPADYQLGGTGAAFACEHEDGLGDGRLPAGVSVGAQSCVVEGDPDDVFGSWVWIVAVEQEGARQLVPYCVVETDEPPNAYAISGDHSGSTDNVLEPAVRAFDPAAPLTFGGDGDPLVRVLGPCGNNSCFYGYTFRVGASPFGECAETDCFGLDPAELLRDTDNNPLGFQHNIFARGGVAPDEFADRPFVLPWTIRYCISQTVEDCEGTQSIEANSDGALHFSVLMLPE